MAFKRFIDVRSPRRASPHTGRINLSTRRVITVPVSKVATVLVIVASISYFMFGSVLAPIQSETFAQSNPQEREQLEKELVELEQQIAQYQSTVQEYKKQGKTLQSEIDRLNSTIAKTNLQIKAINLSLTKLDGEISENRAEIKTTEEKIELNKAAISDSLRALYESDRRGLIEVLLKNPRLSDFFNDVNNLVTVQDTLSVTVEKITALRDELVEETEALALKRKDAAALKAYQDSQRKSLESTKGQKATLLTVTKGQESKYQEIVKEKQKTAAEIRKRIFQFLGGGEMTFEEAYGFAKLSGQATGVRPAFILAILERESALGQNIGRCNYKSAMSPGVPPRPTAKRDDVSVFLALTARLNLNPDSMMVSCANSDGAFGGAMGPAQFIPTTWKLYEKRISQITGHDPASPWNNGDAITGTALYLQDSVTSCGTLYTKQFDIERCAAAKYYAGGRWRTYITVGRYGYRVADRAQALQADIDVLND